MQYIPKNLSHSKFALDSDVICLILLLKNVCMYVILRKYHIHKIWERYLTIRGKNSCLEYSKCWHLSHTSKYVNVYKFTINTVQKGYFCLSFKVLFWKGHNSLGVEAGSAKKKHPQKIDFFCSGFTCEVRFCVGNFRVITLLIIRRFHKL